MVHNIGSHEIGIMTCNALPAESNNGLWHVDIDNDTAPEPAWRRVRNRLEVVLFRQLREGTIDQFSGRFGIDVADN